MIKFFEQEAAFSIGYRAVKARRRGDVRELLDVEVIEVSPVLFGAHPDARLIGVKAGRPPGVEYKSTSGVLPARRRAGMPVASQGGAQSRFAWSEAVFEPRGRSDAMG